MKQFISFLLLVGSTGVYGQNKAGKAPAVVYTLDSTFLKSFEYGIPYGSYWGRSPRPEDYRRYMAYRHLINQQPGPKNYAEYAELAASLWELNKLAEAEKMFLNIMQSQERHYTATEYHASDIPGDKSPPVYGYGSYTSNYKNKAAICLTKIYLEKKQYDKAFQYLEAAVKKYPVVYTCGTGFYWQKDEYDFLYVSCYLGLNKNKEVLDLLLPGCLERNDTIIIAAIKRMYSRGSIKTHLEKALHSIVFLPEVFSSYEYVSAANGTKQEITDTIKYYGGKASIILFGTKLDLMVTPPENGAPLTKQYLIERVKESVFWKMLANG